MAYLNIKSWSTTAASNATVGSINWAEGQAPSTVNDSARYTMADVASFYQAIYANFNARLTLTSLTPITTADVTAAGTLYLTPYNGNQIWLYDGSAQWNLFNLTEISLALTLTSGKPYDVFCYDNAGTPTLEVLVWTDDTTRATLLTKQNSIYVKSGATTRRYVGTIYSSGANITEDSFANRYIWNYYNRVRRPMRVLEGTNTWTYTTASYQQANASTSNQIGFCIGVVEEPVYAVVNGNARNSAGSISASVAIGQDSTTTMASGCVNSAAQLAIVNVIQGCSARWSGYPISGKHYLSWLEQSTASGTTTWIGDNGAALIQSGIQGELFG